MDDGEVTCLESFSYERFFSKTRNRSNRSRKITKMRSVGFNMLMSSVGKISKNKSMRMKKELKISNFNAEEEEEEEWKGNVTEEDCSSAKRENFSDKKIVVSIKTFSLYFKHSKQIFLLIVIIFVIFSYEIVSVLYIKYLGDIKNDDNFLTKYYFMFIYVGILLCLRMIINLTFYNIFLNISNSIHKIMITSLIFSKESFYTQITHGEIMNILSTDLGNLDSIS